PLVSATVPVIVELSWPQALGTEHMITNANHTARDARMDLSARRLISTESLRIAVYFIVCLLSKRLLHWVTVLVCVCLLVSDFYDSKSTFSASRSHRPSLTFWATH